MATGIIDTTFVDLPPGFDNAYIRGLQTRSGLSVAEMITRVDAAMARVNGGVDPLFGMLLAPPTTATTALGGRDSSMKVTKKSEYTLPRPQQVGTSGHMLAIAENELGLGFTEDGLEAISMDAFQSQLDAAVEAFERGFRADALTRLFSDAEVALDQGTTTTSPGFAGSGTGSNAFGAVYPDGTALGGGYTHYYRDTTANRAAVIKTAAARLKTWASGPFDLIGSQVTIDAITALGAPDFIGAGSELVRLGSGAAEANVDAARYVGVFANAIRVWQPLNDYTDDVAAIFKSYGTFAANNPLILRYDPLRGRDAIVRSRATFYPLAEAVGIWKYGINCNNRVGAALIKFAASGSYAPPSTIVY